ncbi:hypothetical protein EUTSA_v10017842mg, partial [Eutrema salsugineum]
DVISVVHTASPVTLIVADPHAEMIDPAVKGTLNVLKTCIKVSSVKKVIVTSSMAAVLARESPFGPNELVDETTFSDPIFCEKKKTLAEDAAWSFSKANEIDLIVMNPGLGKDPFNSKHYRFVDVRDVALAHVKALETPSANGRYIIDGPVVTLNDIEKVLREFYTDLSIADDKNNEYIGINLVTYKVCVGKVKSLGVEFTPTETSLRDTVLCLKEICVL